MKRILIIICLLYIIVDKGFSQQFSQYSTNTLYDSFENPTQSPFVFDASKYCAFNILIPNFNANLTLTGNTQASLLNKIYTGRFDNSALKIGSGSTNNLNIKGNIYFLMFKLFTSFKGDQEMGIFAETKVEGRAKFTDESIALFEGQKFFPNNVYDNKFNDRYYYQDYNVIGITYREQVGNQLILGFKAGFLMGVNYNNLNIYESHVNFNTATDATLVTLRGKYLASKGPGVTDVRSYLPLTRSPGLQISVGASYKNDHHITFQGNIKDMGFIHWYSRSLSSTFNNSTSITGLSTSTPKDQSNSLHNAILDLALSNSGYSSSITTLTDARFELSATKSYYLNFNNSIKYSPTLIASKEMFYNDIAGALVNNFQYKNFNISATASYDNESLFNLGMQIMLKSPNWEFFIGSDKLMHTITLAGTSNNSAPFTNNSYTGASIFMGFSIKFGSVIERSLNSNNISKGEKGFLGRLWNRFFKTYK